MRLLLDVYNQTVDEQFGNYVRPQETANKTDVRWVKLTDENGKGLMVSGDTVLNISARHYLDKDLDDGIEKDNSHTGELRSKRSDYIKY